MKVKVIQEYLNNAISTMLSCNVSKRSLSKPWGTTKQKDLQKRWHLYFYDRYTLMVMTKQPQVGKSISLLTFCSGGPVSFDLLFPKSWLSVVLLFPESGFLEYLKLSLLHLLNWFFLVKAVSDLWWWLVVECRFKADKTSSVVFLISDPKTEASHCFSHNRTCR